jgi:hypothetical protein
MQEAMRHRRLDLMMMYETPSKHFRYDLHFLPAMMRSIVHDGINRSAKLRLEKQDSDLPTAGGGTKVVGRTTQSEAFC